MAKVKKINKKNYHINSTLVKVSDMYGRGLGLGLIFFEFWL